MITLNLLYIIFLHILLHVYNFFVNFSSARVMKVRVSGLGLIRIRGEICNSFDSSTSFSATSFLSSSFKTVLLKFFESCLQVADLD